MAGIDQYIKVITADDQTVELNLRDLIYLRGSDMTKLLYALGYEVDFSDGVFEDILARMLARIPGELDKRQGSVIYDTLATAAVELAASYVEREGNRALSYASMSTGEWLDMRVAEHGIFRSQATKAVRWGLFWADREKTIPFSNISIGGKYSINKVNFIVKAYISPGMYEMECEEAGEIGNLDFGELLPVDYISGLVVAQLDAVITPGENTESDASLYQRFVRWITRPPFGGNRSDYEEYFRKINGVGWVKLFRANPEKGYVKAIILGADSLPPSQNLVENTQSLVDPFVNQGEGLGMAPMAHIVNIYGAEEEVIDISTSLVLAPGIDIGQIQALIEEILGQYFKELREQWATYAVPDQPNYVKTVVRTAVIDATILETAGVQDIYGTLINSRVENIIMQEHKVPVLGTVKLSA